MLLHALDFSCPNLLGQAIDDLYASLIAFVHRAIKRLSSKRLLMHRAVGIAIKEAAKLIFKFMNTFDGFGHQRPSQILIRQPLAALDGVHEMPLDRVARRQRHVVAALHHARTAALAEEALHGHGDLQLRGSLMGVQRGEQPSTARAKNQDVRFAILDVRLQTETPRLASAAARRSATLALIVS